MRSLVAMVIVTLLASELWGQSLDRESAMNLFVRGRAGTSVMPEIRTAVIDLVKGRRGKSTLSLKRMVQVSRRGDYAWSWEDSRPSIFGLVIYRTNRATFVREAPGSSETRVFEGNPSYSDFYDVLYLGFPLNCLFTVERADRTGGANTEWVLLRTPCVSADVLFELDLRSGLPTQAIQEVFDRRTKRRVLLHRVSYLEWGPGSWKMPTRVRWEVFRNSRIWGESEFFVESCLNCRIREGFFEQALTWEMSPDAWRVESEDKRLPISDKK